MKKILVAFTMLGISSQVLGSSSKEFDAKLISKPFSSKWKDEKGNVVEGTEFSYADREGGPLKRYLVSESLESVKKAMESKGEAKAPVAKKVAVKKVATKKAATKKVSKADKPA